MRSRRNLPVLAAAVVSPPLPNTVPAIPEHYATPGLSLKQIFSIFKAYRVHALVTVLVVVAITSALVKILPKTYVATATLMVSNDQRDSLESPGQAQAPPLGTFMATEIQLMQSAEVLLPVIDRLNLAKYPEYSAGYRGSGADLREWVKENLIKSLDVEGGPFGSQLIYITAAAHYPQLAAQIANALADVYLMQERNRVSGPASERAKRYAAELAELKDKVNAAQDQVTAFRQRTGVTMDSGKSNNIEADLLANLESRLLEAQTLRRAAEVKATADQALNSDPKSAPAIGTLNSQINAEEAQLAQLMATLGERHPKVLELQSEIAANRRNLAAAIQTLSSSASAELTGARQMEAKLQAAVEQQRRKVSGVARVQDEGTKYALELESAQNVYKRALDGYDQIMFASEGHFANVTMISQAVPPQQAARPNKIKLILMGAFSGLLLGLGAPAAYEILLNRRVRCRDDFERDFQVPVLMEFNQIPAAEVGS